MNLLDLLVKIGIKDEASDAVEGVSQNIIGKLGSAAATAAKALAGAFAVKKVVDFGKAAFYAYANFEQLAGGTAKIFDELDQSAILDDANRAFLDLNMSANDYLESINTVGATFAQTMGDEKAYDTARTGMKAIADFASGTGANLNELNEKYKLISRSAGSYQSIADQFAGILPQTSNDFLEQAKAAGFLKDSYKKLTDVPVAEYQEAVTKMLEKGVADAGFANNTMKESLSTISGSIAATKAAWQNLVTEFGKPDADIGARISDMFTALMGEGGKGGLVRNVVNEVGTIATNMVNAVSSAISTGIGYISSNGPALVSKAMDAIGKALDSAISGLSSFVENFDLVDAIFGEGGVGDSLSKIGEFVGKIGDTIAQKWPEIQSKLGELLGTLGTAFETVMPQVMEVAGRLVTMAGQAIAEHGPELLGKLGEVVGKAIAGLVKFVADMSQKGHEFMAGLITGTSDEGKRLHEWFANFFPDGLLSGLGDFATFLLDAGKALINGLLDGIGEVAPDVEEAIRGAFQTVLDFFGGVANFIADPIGSIKSGLDSLGMSFGDTSDDIKTETGRAEKSVNDLNKTNLKDKKAKAEVTGNAQDGKAKTAVDNTSKAVKNLSGKNITVSASGNVITGVAKTAVDTIKSAINNLKSKTVTLTTKQRTIKDSAPAKPKSGAVGEFVARGGIRRHARGDIMVANRYTEGVPLDIVGEAGPEAIVPLTSHYGHEFARIMGEQASKYMGGPTYILQIGDIQYNTDKAMDEAIDHWFSVAARKAGQYGIA